ncbi:MAG: antibiotic biosynthesis monooxygenase [Ruminiclostridium sp.]|nr:antibiotic biosynthesis monooxygenase [Ruminiclostridium sp.]
MAITINIYYHGKNGNAKKFAEEMLSSGIVDRIRAEKGNLKYEYFIPFDDAETILLIDSWENQEALDIHHATPMMKEIIRLREKYNLTMKVERFVSDKAGIPEKDKAFIKK